MRELRLWVIRKKWPKLWPQEQIVVACLDKCAIVGIAMNRQFVVLESLRIHTHNSSQADNDMDGLQCTHLASSIIKTRIPSSGHKLSTTCIQSRSALLFKISFGLSATPTSHSFLFRAAVPQMARYRAYSLHLRDNTVRTVSNDFAPSTAGILNP
jgi:hypothetical protein